MLGFTKMHGIGNDYVYIDTAENPVPDPSDLARVLSRARFAVGGDGIILIDPPRDARTADAGMRVFNADGSEAEMCGNGIRCVARFLADRGRARGRTIRIETRAGLCEVERTPAGYRAAMGRPRLRPEEIPTTLAAGRDRVLRAPLAAAGETWAVTCVNVGNPHAVVVLDSSEAIDRIDLARIGPAIERHPAFPERVNVEFIAVLARDRVRQRTWERGSGETLACGTGATAVLVAANLLDLVDRRATIRLAGGELTIEWDDEDNLWMTGPATEVFRGTCDPEAIRAGFSA